MIASPQPPAAVLTTIATLAATPPRTLTIALDTFDTIKALATSLQSTAFANVGVKIVEAAEAASSWGDNRPRTLPQARERLMAIGALAVPGAQATPAAPTAEANPFAEKIARMRERAATSTAAPGVPLAPDAAADSSIYDRYAALKGATRQSYFSEHRAALVRENARRAKKVPTPEQSDVLAKYRALTGADRQAFYAQHERDLWDAYRRTRNPA